MPYDIPLVSYDGTDPDPVEWANENVRPAILDLDARASSVPGFPVSPINPVGTWMSGFVARDNNITSQIGGVLVAVPFIPATTFTADRIAIEVTTAGTAGGTHTIALYANTAGSSMPGAHIVTLGSVATDSTGIKELTINRVFNAGEQVFIVGNPSVSFSSRGFDPVGYPSPSTDQTEALQAQTSRVFLEWNGGTIGTAWPSNQTGRNLRQIAYAFRRSA